MKINQYIFKLVLIFSILWIFEVMNSCQSKKSEKSEMIFYEITDSYQRHIVLNKEPQRIISLSPAFTEFIFTLNSGYKLVGRTDFCTYPDSALLITSIGSFNQLNTDKIISLEPDLIIIGSMISKSVVELFEKADIPVICLKEEQEISGLFRNLENMGNILNQKNRAQYIADSLQQIMKHINYSQKTNKPSVYYVVGFGASGDYTAPGSSHIGDMIRLAGGRNIAENLQGWKFSREMLFKENPDIIFIRQEDYDAFCRTEPYLHLKAVKNKKVYPIESGWVDVVGIRSITGLEYMSQKIAI